MPERPTPERPTPGRLFVVGTPIGNLEDITLRALRVLREVDLIAAEDTRVSARLLGHYGIATPLTPYDQHSRGQKAQLLVEELRSGKSVALISDAGMPGVSDPGWDLVGEALEAAIEVVPVPGPTAAIAALTVSGLPAFRFAFEGFPPRTVAGRRAFFASLRSEVRTLIFYESSRRLLATLEMLGETLGQRRVAVARDLTKASEAVVRGTLAELVQHYTHGKPMGQYVLVIEGAGCAGP
jgi:16S rRNA (cytidine1402-2'-O)-methyltransferase